MSQREGEPESDRVRSALNLTLAGVAGSVGCLTVLIIFVALFAGLWLDNQLQTRPMFTILFLIGSVPVTLVAMFWVVRTATGRIKPDEEQEKAVDQEE
ncbi:MAG: AtpZ/AtpI family protein [Anaerolineales bacterium]|nr:AtpZ/AtpI family protein [Anaerolineales bacterium]